MYELYDYIVENLEDIITLVFTFINKGGLTEGKYQYIDYTWIKKD